MSNSTFYTDCQVYSTLHFKGMTGKHHSEETKKKMSEAQKKNETRQPDFLY